MGIALGVQHQRSEGDTKAGCAINIIIAYYTETFEAGDGVQHNTHTRKYLPTHTVREVSSSREIDERRVRLDCIGFLRLCTTHDKARCSHDHSSRDRYTSMSLTETTVLYIEECR